MELSMIRKVMMDIAVPQETGGPLASSVEECACPPEYSGASCQECSDGHMRGEGGDCVAMTESPPRNPRVRPMGQKDQHRQQTENTSIKGYPRPQDTMKGYPRPQPRGVFKGYELPRAQTPDYHRSSYQTPLPGPHSVGELCPSVSVSVEPPEQTVAQGGGAVMRCVGGGPGDQVTWQKVGTDMSSPSVSVTEDTVTIRSGLMWHIHIYQ